MRSEQLRKLSAAAARADHACSARLRSRSARTRASRPVDAPSGFSLATAESTVLDASMGCLDENILSGYLRRALQKGEQARAEDHLRRCAICRQLVACMAKVFGGGCRPVAGV